MLHRINLPPYEEILKEFLQFQRQFLKFACTPAHVHPLQSDVLEAIFPTHIADWLWKKLHDKGTSPKVTEHLMELVTYIQGLPDEPARNATRDRILEAFDHDTAFNHHTDDAQFHFAYFDLNESLRNLLKPLMVYCYDLLCQGFPIHTSATKIESFTRNKLVEAFWDKNEKDLTVCPGCDGQRPPRSHKIGKKASSRNLGKREKKTYADADHSFPRSLYPFLSVHAWNLIPMCVNCNRIKGDTDPIENHEQQTLEDIFHPYKRPAVDNIAIEIVTAARTASEVKIVPAPHAIGNRATARIKNLNRILHLEDRWSGSYMDDILSQIHRDLREDGRYRLGNQRQVDASLVEDYLRKILYEEENKIGKEQYYLLKRGYANYALTNADEYNHLVGILFGQEDEGAENREEKRETEEMAET